MKIIYKLLLCFLSLAFFIWLVGYLSVNASQRVLEKTLVEESVHLAATIMDVVDRSIFSHIEIFEEYTTDLTLRNTILESNLEFEKMTNVQAYIDGKEQEWISTPKEENTPFMRELMNKELSKELVEKVKYYAEEYDYKIFGEVFVTNRYGANIAMTGKTTDYRQDDEGWWQKAKNEGTYVRDVEYDESAGIKSIDIGIRIDDEQGNFIGVMKVVLHLDSVIDIIKELELAELQKPPEHRDEFKLLTKEGRTIYSTEEFKFLDDQYGYYVSKLGRYGSPEHKDHLIFKKETPAKGDVLVAHGHSKGYRSFKGLGWFLAVEHKTKDIFAPVYQLKEYLTYVFIVMTAFAVLMAILLWRTIARPIKILSDASSRIGEGNLDTKIQINSNDEVGQLASSFNNMTEDLQKTTVSRDELACKVVEHEQAENKILRQSRVLEAINKIFLERIRCNTEEELSKACLAVAEELTDSKFGFIGKLNEKGLFDSITISDQGWDICKILEDQAILVIKGIFVGGNGKETMREERSKIYNDYGSIKGHPALIELPEGHLKITSFLSVPLKRSETIIGMIGLGNKDGGYGITDQKNIEAVATSMIEALESKRAEGRVEHLAYFDNLTGLPNRKLFFDRLNQGIYRVKRTERSLALLYIDLDNFKNVNDTQGHPIGDILLKAVGNRLSKNLRKNTTASRLGGDEFAVIIEDITDSHDIINVADRIIDSLKTPLKLSGSEVFVSASLGIAIYPNDGDDAKTLLKNADTAMYHAKKLGKNNYQFFSTKMNVELEKRVGIETTLRHALKKDDFTLHYQPQVDFETGSMIGVESLIRWRPDGGDLISPADFIPVAEEASLILDIDKWVLREACAQMKLWHEAGFTAPRISVNISPLHFRRSRIIETVDTILEETGLNPDCLEIEITEGVLMEDIEEAVSTLGQLRSRGITIALDDFGTGYSSLNYLKRFPINRVKIDRSFVNGVTNDPDDAAITKTIIAMAQNLNMRVIAEGVETKEQLDFLHTEGCNQMQGYYFSKPLPADAFKKLMGKGANLKKIWRRARDSNP